jgi:hypothetical protein
MISAKALVLAPGGCSLAFLLSSPVSFDEWRQPVRPEIGHSLSDICSTPGW